MFYILQRFYIHRGQVGKMSVDSVPIDQMAAVVELVESVVNADRAESVESVWLVLMSFDSS